MSQLSVPVNTLVMLYVANTHRSKQRPSVKFVNGVRGQQCSLTLPACGKGIWSLCCCHGDRTLIWTPGFLRYHKREREKQIVWETQKCEQEHPGREEKLSQKMKSGERVRVKWKRGLKSEKK